MERLLDAEVSDSVIVDVQKKIVIDCDLSLIKRSFWRIKRSWVCHLLRINEYDIQNDPEEMS